VRYFAKIWIISLAVMLAGFLNANAQSEPVGRSGPVVTSDETALGGPFELIDQHGETVTHEDLKGKPHLMYFGFGYCPDVCPLDMQRLGAALAKADPGGDFFRPVFITVDPERDTVERLKLYAQSNGFAKGLITLTGSQAKIDQAKAAYKVYAQKRPDPVSAAEYTFDHSNFIYLMDKEGGYVELYSSTESVEMIANRLSAYKSDHSGGTKKAILIAFLVFGSFVFFIIGRMGRNALKGGDAPASKSNDNWLTVTTHPFHD